MNVVMLVTLSHDLSERFSAAKAKIRRRTFHKHYYHNTVRRLNLALGRDKISSRYPTRRNARNGLRGGKDNRLF